MVTKSDAAQVKETDGVSALEKPATKPTSRLVDHVEVEVEILLGTTQVTVAELGLLKRGDVLEVDRHIGEAVDIQVNDRTIGRGEIVTVDDKFAVRVTQISD